jgi:hypothetical protein
LSKTGSSTTRGEDDGTSESHFGREGATSEDMFPESRKGALDCDLLERLGLTKERMKKEDALFFHQLLLPMCDPKMLGINGDPRKGFYSKVEFTLSKLGLVDHMGIGIRI